ncbi:MAG: hypothetical protein IKW21_04505 [Lachnospiraceae bacterium]|nr:hypothetical protein [Lachnospiraceae bacterium]
MGLFSIFGNKKERIVPGHRLDRLDENGEVPYGWHYANREFIQNMEDHHQYFMTEYYNAKREEQGILAVYAALKSLILYMEDAKRICESMGECFAAWASYSICNEAFMETCRNDLKQIDDNIDELIRKENLIKWLRPELLKIVREEPGIVQSDIYKRFDPELKFEIQNQMYLLWSKDIIIREKSGRSYKLYIK